MSFYKQPLITLAVASSLFTVPANADNSLNNKKNYQYFSSSDNYSQQINKQKPLSQSSSVIFHQNSIAKPEFPFTKSAQELDRYFADYYLTKLMPRVATESVAKEKSSSNSTGLVMMHNTGKGPIIAKYKQMVNGVEVIGREMNILMNDSHELVASSGFFADPNQVSAVQKSSTNITPEDAFQYAVKDLFDASVFAIVQKTKQVNQYQHFEVTQTSSDFRLDKDARSKKVWYDSKGQLHPAYYLELFGKDKDNQQFAYSYVIDSNNGKVLARKSLVEFEDFTYRVFTPNAGQAEIFEGPQGHEYPIIGTDPVTVNANFNRVYQAASHQLVTLNSAPFSRNDPWLPAGATTTDGNNVKAYLDIAGSDGFDGGDVIAETTSVNTFDYSYNADLVAATNSRKASVVNLFYMNNWLHDWMYDSGFDEASLNAQNDNFGRGGSGNDAINAEGQDSSGRNNANMATPSDGRSPRMQMYLYDGPATQGSDYDLTLTGVSGLTNPNPVGFASFGPLEYAAITADVVAYTDATAPTFDACEVPTNAAALAGKIAFVDRGSCNFTVKVKNSQDAGAVATIVANNSGGTEVINLGGSDDSITIPSMMVTQNDGATIRTALASGTVSATLYKNNSDVDGTLDNAIIAHEWGHYITNRLVANAFGLSNNQGGSLGEGWGDFMALLTFVGENDRNVVGNEQYQALYPMFGWADQDAYFGIRRVPYTTNMALNGLTFKHIEDGVALPSHPVRFGADGANNSAVHASGTVWGTVLWEIYASLLNTHDFDTAQQRMKDYLVASLKMTPASPTFLEARDAMLMVGKANDAADYDLMLTAFAKRGMGIGAVAPVKDSDTHAGVVESFIVRQARYNFTGANLDNGFTSGFCTDDGILDVGETSLLTVSIKNTGTEDLTNVAVKLSSSAAVSFENGGVAQIASLPQFASTDLSFQVTLNSAQTAEDIGINVEFPEASAGDVIFEPTMEILNYKVNFDLGPDATRNTEDFALLRAVEQDWSRQVGPLTIGDATAVGLSTASVINPVDGRADLGNALMFVDNDFRSDVSFVSPQLTLGSADFSIDFEHFYDFESDAWDGAVIEISVDGGAWQDVTNAGGTFAIGYNGTISSAASGGSNPDSPIDGRSAFVNTSTSYLNESINFGTAHANKTVQLRFRQGTDANTGGFGWIIDNIKFTGVTNAFLSGIVANTVNCNSTAPVAAVAQSVINVRENESVSLDASGSMDPQNDTLTYSWAQLSGSAVTLTNSTASVATFTSPNVSANEALVFEVTVSDGSEESKAQVTVNVEANQAPIAQVAQASISVNEGSSVTLNASNSTDANGDTLTYSWLQTSGSAITLTDANSATASFTAPEVSADTNYAFEVTVSDAEFNSTATVDVTVRNVAPVAPPAAPSSGGGGSFSLITLLALSLLGLGRRRRRA